MFNNVIYIEKINTKSYVYLKQIKKHLQMYVPFKNCLNLSTQFITS